MQVRRFCRRCRKGLLVSDHPEERCGSCGAPLYKTPATLTWRERDARDRNRAAAERGRRAEEIDNGEPTGLRCGFCGNEIKLLKRGVAGNVYGHNGCGRKA
jgi:hypothetical protein